MTREKIKVIGFDLDDTLVMSEGPSYHFENKILQMMGLPKMDRRIHKAAWGQNTFEAIATRSPGIDEKKFGKLFIKELKKRLENSSMDGIKKDVEKTLVKLGNQGYYMFILTGRGKEETAHLMSNSHPINIHIKSSNIYHKDILDFTKPDPRAFKWLWEKGFKPEECVYVGDASYDAEAATKAGMHFIATLESGNRKKEDFRNYQVSEFINKFSDLDKILT